MEKKRIVIKKLCLKREEIGLQKSQEQRAWQKQRKVQDKKIPSWYVYVRYDDAEKRFR